MNILSKINLKKLRCWVWDATLPAFLYIFLNSLTLKFFVNYENGKFEAIKVNLKKKLSKTFLTQVYKSSVFLTELLFLES